MDPTPPRLDSPEPGSPTSNVLSLWEVPQLDLSVLYPIQPPTPSSQTPYPSFPLIPQNQPLATSPQSVFGRPLYLGSSSSATQPPPPSPPPPSPTKDFSGYLSDYNIQFPNQAQESAPPQGSFPHAAPTNFYSGFDRGVLKNDEMIHNGFVNVGDMGFGNFDVGMFNREGNYNSFEVNQSAIGGYENNNPSMVQGTPPNTTLTCGCCIVLRRVIHSDGVTTKKLEIHGGSGCQFHAICEVEYQFNGVPVTTNQLFDFSMQSFDKVKYFVLDYFKLQEQEQTQHILHDSVSDLYTSLCVEANPTSNQMLNHVETTQRI